MKKKILFITDSLGLPRLVPEKVTYEETYINLCKEAFPAFDFINLCIGGAEITTLSNQLFYYQAVAPDLVIIQSGIVDCAPRALSPVEMAILNSNSVIKKISKKILKPLYPYLRKYRKQTSTNIETFGSYIEKFISNFGATPVYWSSIIPATHGYERQIPGIGNNILKYNDVISKAMLDKYIDNSDFNETMVMSDHHHLNTLGHKHLFDKLEKIISLHLSSSK